MGCSHKMKQGAVVTVINAGGLAGGCSFCREEVANARIALLEDALERIHQGVPMPWKVAADALFASRSLPNKGK